MAAKGDDRTEKPTPKRRQKARRDGTVARSPEVSAWVGLFVVTLALPAIFRLAAARIESVMSLALVTAAHPSPAGAVRVLEAGLRAVLVAIALPALIGVALALVLGVAQVGLHWSPAALRPRLSRLNPAAGLRKLVSPTSLFGLAKDTVKLAVVGFVGYRAVVGELRLSAAAPPAALGGVVVDLGGVVRSALRLMALAGVVLALADYAWQRHETEKSLKMTKQEVKDETKQAEGDPAVKGRIRGRQRALARRRMMAAVARADVLVVNPTHVAVALSYDPASGNAPRVVAKGADELAARLREVALAHGVPVVADPPLARALHSACEIDVEIPPALYAAVARVLAFVYRLPPISRQYGGVHHLASGA